MIGLRAWFAGRSLRERRMLVAMLAVVVFTILWFGIVLPVDDALASARERHADAVVRLAETKTAVDALTAAHKPRPLTGSLADAVRARADAAGFALATLDEQGPGRIHVTIQAIRPGVLSAWLADAEMGGILVDAATLRDNGDETVGADLVLKARTA